MQQVTRPITSIYKSNNRDFSVSEQVRLNTKQWVCLIFQVHLRIFVSILWNMLFVPWVSDQQSLAAGEEIHITWCLIHWRLLKVFSVVSNYKSIKNLSLCDSVASHRWIGQLLVLIVSPGGVVAFSCPFTFSCSSQLSHNIIIKYITLNYRTLLHSRTERGM